MTQQNHTFKYNVKRNRPKSMRPQKALEHTKIA